MMEFNVLLSFNFRLRIKNVADFISKRNQV